MVLAVYDTLWVALLGMALSSLGFSNALAVVILRKRFAKSPPLIPLQKAINVGLKLGLGLFVVSWAYAFGVRVKAVARALMNHDFIPVLFLFFSPLISLACSWSLFGIALRARSKEVEELATEIHTLHATKAASDDWSDAWRAREVEAMKSQLATDPERVNGHRHEANGITS